MRDPAAFLMQLQKIVQWKLQRQMVRAEMHGLAMIEKEKDKETAPIHW